MKIKEMRILKGRRRIINMNKVMLIGRLTKDPDLRFTQNKGTAVTQITLAVDKYVNGEKQADFIQVVMYGKSAENTANYMLKGSLMAVSGRLQNRSYDAKDGTKRYVTEVIANEVQFLGKAKGTGQGVIQDVINDNYDDMTPIDDGDIPF
jgi:single-strand DNA-binding protein